MIGRVHPSCWIPEQAEIRNIKNEPSAPVIRINNMISYDEIILRIRG